MSDEVITEVPVDNSDEGMQSASQVFSEDQVYNSFLYKARLIETDYLPQLVMKIGQAPLTYACKTSLWTVVLGLFEKSVVLAKESDLDIAAWDAEIILLSTTQAFSSHDADQPELYTIMSMILEHYHKFISRSAGGWERELQNRIETSHTQANVQRILGPKQPKRGFKLPWGGD